MKRSVRQFAATDAAEIAEAALVLPLVFMFLLGIVWFGRAFNTYSTIQQAAQQGAILAARATCATCGDAQPMPAAAASAVTAVMQASSLDPTQIVNNPAPTNCTSSTYNIIVCQQVVLSLSPNPSQPQSCGSPPEPSPSQICGAIVTFQYPFQFYFPYTALNLSTVTLTADAQSRMEN